MRKTNVNRIRIVGAALAVSLLVAGCAPQPTTPQADIVCAAQADLQASLDEFRALDPGSNSVDEYQQAWLQVRQAFNDLRDAGYELADEKVTELNDAIDEVKAALDNLSDSSSLAEALAALEPALESVSAAWDEIGGELPCETPEP
jgi:cell fate (sporulation/competence/biofilm development) regulator YlbF (YheA/YmcA/DUF963 family)